MNLFSAADKLAALDRSSLAFAPDRCLHSLDKFTECKACFDLCPVGAIEVGKPPVFHESLCQQCYACLATCPVGAYHGTDAVQSLLVTATRLEVESLELLCQHNADAQSKTPEAEASVRVRGCLAGLGSGAYLMLRGLGIKKIFMRRDACVDCPWSSLGVQIESQVEQAQRLLDLWGYQDTLVFIEEDTLMERDHEELVWDGDNPPLSRRGLFKMLSSQGQRAFARLAMDSELPQQSKPSLNYLRTSMAVELLGAESVEAPSHILGDIGLAILDVNEDCSACGTCVQVCPTEALALEKTEEGDLTSFRLIFHPSLCVACGACTHVCYPQAISVDLSPSFDAVFGKSQPRVLCEGTLTQCAKCNRPFAQKADEQFCPPCEFRNKNPLGSQIPPGLLKQQQMARKQNE